MPSRSKGLARMGELEARLTLKASDGGVSHWTPGGHHEARCPSYPHLVKRE